MSTFVAQRINLVVDQKMQLILAHFKSKFPLLKYVEIIKMAISGFYTSEIQNLPIQTFDQKEDESLSKSLKSKTNQNLIFSKVPDLMNYLDN